MTVMAWIYAHWAVVAPFLGALLPLIAKIPFVEHSTLLEFILNKIIARLLPADPSPESAKDVAAEQDPKK